MASMLKSLKLLSDPTRLRILMLVGTEALSVAELQEILGMGQSRISTQLSQLKTAGLVTDERSGKNNMYSCTAAPDLMEVAQLAAEEVPEVAADQAALRHLLRKRKDTRPRLFRRTGRPFRQGLRARPLVEGARRGAHQGAQLQGRRRPRGRRRHPGPTPRPTRRKSHRRGSFAENGRVRPGSRHSKRPDQSGIPPRRHRRSADRRDNPSISPSSARPCTMPNTRSGRSTPPSAS